MRGPMGTGRRNSELAAAVKKIGHDVTAVQGDVSNLGDLDRLFAQIKRSSRKWKDAVDRRAGDLCFQRLQPALAKAPWDSEFGLLRPGLHNGSNNLKIPMNQTFQRQLSTFESGE
jgi:hypothetical protein